MLQTFSVNTDVYAKMPKVTKLNLNPIRDIEQAWLSEAYMKIIEGKKEHNLSLSAYAAACEKNAVLSRVTKGEVALLDDSEVAMGYMGLPEMLFVSKDNSLEKVENRVDTEYFVTSFIEIREYIYLEDGKDIWRLLDLARQGNKKAQSKLRVVLDAYVYLKELVEYVIKTPCCFAKLSAILT